MSWSDAVHYCYRPIEIFFENPLSWLAHRPPQFVVHEYLRAVVPNKNPAEPVGLGIQQHVSHHVYFVVANLGW
jgi:hypothetical protein